MKYMIVVDSAEFPGGKEIRILLSPLGKELIKAVVVFIGLGLLFVVYAVAV